jgi:competence protein ComEC
MSDRWVLLLAASALAGAARPSPLPVGVGVGLVLAALLVRRPALLCLGTAALVSALAARSVAGLDEVTEGPVVGEVVLLGDPTPSFGGVRAEARWKGRHVELRAAGPSADALRARSAGEQVQLRGSLRAVPDPAPWLAARHVGARLQVFAVEGWAPGTAPSRAANGLRRTLLRGAGSLSARDRSLFMGVVVGDDRDQPPELADDFRGAGLTHLLAVSGQNVAFVLALAGPVLRRLRLWPRLASTLAVIAMFGVVTRFEPSVVRAAAMAALATATVTAGHPISRLRVLALAVTALLVVDPLLVRSAGFQLSTGAAAAIVVAAPAIAGVLPGPGAVREALAVTLAAQLGVAPVLLTTFGPVPVASIPANLLAVPAAGPVMVWGLTGGLLAGLVGGPVAGLVHAPTQLLLAWLAGVAARASRLPLGQLQAGHLLLVAAGLLVAVAGRRRACARLQRLGVAAAAAAVLAATMSAQAAPPLRSALAPGLVRWHGPSTEVLVLGGAGGRSAIGASSALAALRTAGVGGIDLLVVADPSVPPAVVEVIETRHPIGAVALAGGADLPEVSAPVQVAPRPGALLAVGTLAVRLTATGERVVVEATPRDRALDVAPEPPR